MKKDLFAQIILDFHQRKLPKIIERDTTIKMSKNKAIAIIGPRRAGKTYFLFNIMQRLMSNVDKSQILYVNLEDDRLLPLSLNDMSTFLETYYEIYPENKSKRVYMFLDEVQNLSGWEIFVRRVMDSENVQMFITGSSSKLLSKEIATSMRGRSLSYYILPFSFREILNAKGIKIKKYISSETKAKMMNTLREYMKSGGFPEVVLEDDKETKLRILREYSEIMLMRDIVERHSIKNIRILKMLFNYILSSFGAEFSVHRYYNILRSQGIKISKNTLYLYLQYLEDAFGIISVRRFSYSLVKIEQSLPKIYPIDTGYIWQSGMNFSPNTGRLMENLVAVELLRREYANPMLQFYYWKDTSYEVDFVIKEGERVRELIQVTYASGKDEIERREIKALKKASEELRCRNLTVITWDYDDDKEGIKFIPLWSWLLKK